MDMKKDIKLITFDLDFTLLNSRKEVSAANRDALLRAAGAGIEIAPATGRFYDAIPEAVRELPIHYAITVNGAIVFDVRRRAAIAHNRLNCETALEVMRFLDARPVIYDAVMDDWGYMSREHFTHMEDFFDDEHQVKSMRMFRRPVDDLKAFVRDRGEGLNKIVAFTLDRELRDSLLRELPVRFPGTAISSSYANNIEINDARANKGAALETLAACLGIDMRQTLAFGDGLNDAGMLKAAGTGVAMGNGCDAALAAADFVTLGCDEDGVAAGIERFCRLPGDTPPCGTI